MLWGRFIENVLLAFSDHLRRAHRFEPWSSMELRALYAKGPRPEKEKKDMGMTTVQAASHDSTSLVPYYFVIHIFEQYKLLWCLVHIVLMVIGHRITRSETIPQADYRLEANPDNRPPTMVHIYSLCASICLMYTPRMFSFSFIRRRQRLLDIPHIKPVCTTVRTVSSFT
ncbi:hypothetical protein BDV24DRAFT_134837 [Aspergillus arachidicola]|uniref:Uncharacterized protein n=1 Tax=Aspergillus arachidicola TaxID=656916 RepID=A0A5N6Y576_9EURO|nr:hypothetical protein BDV24DRAFT_134837 [Aspergillus arachidicola]